MEVSPTIFNYTILGMAFAGICHVTGWIFYQTILWLIKMFKAIDEN